VITAVAAVFDEVGVVELGEFDQFVVDADLLGHTGRLVEFGCRKRLAFGRTGNRLVAEGFVASAATTAESTPPEKATRTPSQSARSSRRAAAFSLGVIAFD